MLSLIHSYVMILHKIFIILLATFAYYLYTLNINIRFLRKYFIKHTPTYSNITNDSVDLNELNELNKLNELCSDDYN